MGGDDLLQPEHDPPRLRQGTRTGPETRGEDRRRMLLGIWWLLTFLEIEVARNKQTDMV